MVAGAGFFGPAPAPPIPTCTVLKYFIFTGLQGSVVDPDSHGSGSGILVPDPAKSERA